MIGPCVGGSGGLFPTGVPSLQSLPLPPSSMPVFHSLCTMQCCRTRASPALHFPGETWCTQVLPAVPQDAVELFHVPLPQHRRRCRKVCRGQRCCEPVGHSLSEKDPMTISHGDAGPVLRKPCPATQSGPSLRHCGGYCDARPLTLFPGVWSVPPPPEFCLTTQHLLGGSLTPPTHPPWTPPPLLSDWANFSTGLRPIKIFSGAFGASQFRPKNIFGAFGTSNNSGSPWGGAQYANYWAPLTRKRHTMPHLAKPRHTNYWAPRTRKRHQQEHRPQRPTERSDPTQHAKGRTGDCPGPRKETTT